MRAADAGPRGGREASEAVSVLTRRPRSGYAVEDLRLGISDQVEAGQAPRGVSPEALPQEALGPVARDGAPDLARWPPGRAG